MAAVWLLAVYSYYLGYQFKKAPLSFPTYLWAQSKKRIENLFSSKKRNKLGRYSVSLSVFSPWFFLHRVWQFAGELFFFFLSCLPVFMCRATTWAARHKLTSANRADRRHGSLFLSTVFLIWNRFFFFFYFSNWTQPWRIWIAKRVTVDPPTIWRQLVGQLHSHLIIMTQHGRVEEEEGEKKRRRKVKRPPCCRHFKWVLTTSWEIIFFRKNTHKSGTRRPVNESKYHPLFSPLYSPLSPGVGKKIEKNPPTTSKEVEGHPSLYLVVSPWNVQEKKKSDT